MRATGIQAGNDVFQGYAYAYPHKTAYRTLDPPRPLREVWCREDLSALFLYVHLPFCEMRCGFCNLFAMTNPGEGFVGRYLAALERQGEETARALGVRARFARLAVGGGTPTFLSTGELDHLLNVLGRLFPGISETIPKAIEASPATIDEEKLVLLKQHGVTRLSVGVQSFIEAETRALGRPQKTADLQTGLSLAAAAAFGCLNIDLIYGAQGQTAQTWRHSLEQALEYNPQEIYLYPLYVRPLTGLDRIGRTPADERLLFYRLGRDFLASRGYHQISMRLFRASGYAPPEGPVYCCQEDGMIGLGAGARSYSSLLHYSTEYAVGVSGVREIIEDYCGKSRAEFGAADYGCQLDAEEQRRRYVLKSLLRIDGLSLESYKARFGTDAFTDLPELAALEEENLGVVSDATLQLNERGFELSDVIGPWLFSEQMKKRMTEFALS